ncbi:hypothetical protein BD309DRAFT_344217 [Dichomitus squalens]|nr:hypothetical protein BD309DRAFT_344217 [Dichomitus squalens]
MAPQAPTLRPKLTRRPDVPSRCGGSLLCMSSWYASCFSAPELPIWAGGETRLSSAADKPLYQEPETEEGATVARIIE